MSQGNSSPGAKEGPQPSARLSHPHLPNCFPDELPWPQSRRPTANVNLTSPGPSQAPGQKLHPCEPQFSGKLVPFHDADAAEQPRVPRAASPPHTPQPSPFTQGQAPMALPAHPIPSRHCPGRSCCFSRWCTTGQSHDCCYIHCNGTRHTLSHPQPSPWNPPTGVQTKPLALDRCLARGGMRPVQLGWHPRSEVGRLIRAPTQKHRWGTIFTQVSQCRPGF